MTYAADIFVNGKSLFTNYSMATAGDLSSEVIDIRNAIGYSVQTRWSGAGATDALVLIQGSNDGTNFVSVSSVLVGAASGANLLNVERAMYKFMRVVFDKNSETTGTLNVDLCVKAL